MEKKIIIIGSGPAGLTARIGAKEMGQESLILEKADRPSLKLLASGGTKCNFSNMLSVENFMEKFGRNGKFMRNALLLTFRQWVIDFLHSHHIETTLADDFYCFPASGGAQGIQKAFCEGFSPIETFAEVTEILTENSAVKGVKLKDGRIFHTRKVILAAGSCAWQGLGSKKGLILAEKCGHTIIEPLGAVAPLYIREEWVKLLAGVSLEKAQLVLTENKTLSGGRKKSRILWKTEGNLLFTHEGLSGFAALDMAHPAGKHFREKGEATLYLRLFPEKSIEELRELCEIYRKEYGSKLIRSLLAEREKLPRSLANIISELAHCENMTACRLTSEAKEELFSLLYNGLPLHLAMLSPVEKAMACSGGVSLKEIDPATLESKLVKGLYFAGEIMDITGPCGGYNIQWAISSGRLAGQSAAAEQNTF